MKVITILALTCIAFLAPSATASAGDNSGGSEYLPSVPEADGTSPEKGFGGDGTGDDGGPSGSGHSGNSSDQATPSGGSGGLPASTAEDLQSQGDDGAAAAAAAAATAPDSKALEQAKRRRAERKREQAVADRPAKPQGPPEVSPVADASKAGVTGSGDQGIGTFFPILLGLGLLVALAVIGRRLRARS